MKNYRIYLLENGVRIGFLCRKVTNRGLRNKVLELRRKTNCIPKTIGYDEKRNLVKVSHKLQVVRYYKDGREEIISEYPYKLREVYKVIGSNLRLSSKEVLDHVILKGLSETNIKQILLLKNKLIIESDLLFLIICKNRYECVKLYNYIRMYCYDNKIKHIMFFGSVREFYLKQFWYEKLHKRLKVSYQRLYRVTSR